MVRFRELAEGTLRRLSRAYLADEIGRSLSWIMTAAIPIVGLLYFHWSANEWLFFLLAGAWIGIILDVFKLYFLNSQIMKSAATAHEDNFVWTIVDALRQGQDMAPHDHLRAEYQPRTGVAIDIVFGAVGTLMSIGLFPEALFAAFHSFPLFWSVVGVAAYRGTLTAWEIYEQLVPGAKGRRVVVAVGLRGVGLFMLGFLLGIVSDIVAGGEGQANLSGNQTAWWKMFVVNIVVIVASLLNIWGVFMIRSNAKWLRKYIEDQSG